MAKEQYTDFLDNGFPVLKSNVLEPANAPILTVAAKKPYRNWMLTIGMHKKDSPGFRPIHILLFFVGAIAAVWLVSNVIDLPNSTTTTQSVTTERAAQAALKAEASFRQYLGWRMSQPGVKPGRYVKALEEISFEGSSMFLSLSIREYDEAVRLCNMAFIGWPARKEHGITRVKVVFSSSRYSILAESARKASGEDICR